VDLDVEALCGAGCDVKSGERTNSRTATAIGTWDTRADTNYTDVSDCSDFRLSVSGQAA
jgi:hypothetical protein